MVRKRQLAAAVLVVVLASQAPPTTADENGQPEAMIGTGERLQDHEAAAGDIHRQEASPEDIHAHEGAGGTLGSHHGAPESLRDHHAGSEKLEDHSAQSERLSGEGHPVGSPEQGLADARAKLRAARERHGIHAHGRRDSSASLEQQFRQQNPQLGATTQQWKDRLDIARQRLEVAEQRAKLMDTRYAKMMRNDYPRGDARQQLIDERDAAKQRLEGEQAAWPKLLERARTAGVPQGVLARYAASE